MARSALQGDALSDMLEELEERGVEEDTLEKIADGMYSVNSEGVIWKTGSPLIVKGTSPLPNAGKRVTKSSKFDIKSMLEVFDSTVSPKDWHEIFMNWKETAKKDHNAARSLFETRFGKAPTRVQLMISDDSGNRLDNAYSRTLERMEKLKQVQQSPVLPGPDEDVVVRPVIDMTVSTDGEIRPKLKVRRKLARDD